MTDNGRNNGSGASVGASDDPKQQQELLHVISRHSMVGVAVVINGRFTYVNDAITRLTGHSQDELLSMPPGGFAHIVHPEDRDTVMSRFRRRSADESGLSDHHELRVVSVDGSVKWVSVHTGRVEMGETPALVASVVDITERKQAEQALRQSEERYRNLFDNDPVGIALVTVEGTIVEINRAVERISILPREQLIGANINDFESFNPEAVRAINRIFERLKQGEVLEPFEVELAGDREQSDWLEIYPSLLGQQSGQPYVHVIVRNTTEARKAERALRQSEERYRNLFNLAPIGIALLDMDGTILNVNRVATEIVRYRTTGLIGKRISEFETANEHLHPLLQSSFRALLEKGWIEPFEVELRRDDARPQWLEFFPSLLGEEQGPRYIHLMVRDITEKKLAEEALRRSEEKYRNLFQLQPTGIVIFDMQGRLLDLNDTAVSMTGVSRQQCVAKRYDEMSEQYGRALAVFNGPFSTACSGQKVEPFEIPIRSGPEQGGWAEVSCDLIGGKGLFRAVQFILLDVTQRKKAEKEKRELEAQLRQQQKLESLGTLAAGVAHEINNPVTGIMNFAQLITNRTQEGEQVREFAENIISESWRVSEIVKNLLAFSRQEKKLHGPARLHEMVEATLMLVRTLLRRDRISIEVDIPDELPQVHCRSQQIQQVLMNILTNARDALVERYADDDENKVITIAARALQKNARSWVRLTVTDRGAGIRPEIADRIFDPFFTTKPFDRGTGLGLAVSYGIVKEHGGELWFESSVNRETRFHLDLPAES